MANFLWILDQMGVKWDCKLIIEEEVIVECVFRGICDACSVSRFDVACIIAHRIAGCQFSVMWHGMGGRRPS